MSSEVNRFFKLAFVIVSLALTVAATPPSTKSAQVEEGRAAISLGDYQKALDILEPLAETGDSDAQNAMGWLYLHGSGVAPDPERAVSFFQRSAEQGNVKGTMNLAHAYRTGNGVKTSCVQARNLLEPHAQNGVAAAQVTLGAIYDEGCPDLPADPGQAFRWYSEAAAQDDPYGFGNMASMYALGLGVDQSYSEAMKYYRRAADLGNGKAAYNLGRMYEFGEGMPSDPMQAKQWYLKAVELGEQEAEQRLLALDRGTRASRVDSTDLLTEAMRVPPVELAQSVSSIQNVMEMLPLAEAGVTLKLPDGEVNKDNVAAVRDELELRLAIYEQAIENRGVEVLLDEYVAVADKCNYSQSSWAALIAKGYDHVFVSQNGSEVVLEASKKRRRNNPERSASGILVENVISLIDPMNSDYVLNGESRDGVITIHPDVESILQAWPDFIQPPSRANLSSCVVTLMPVGYSRRSPADVTAVDNKFEALAGKGAIYIHRAKKLAASEVTFRVELNEEIVGPMAPNEYYRLDLNPGDYVVTVSSRDIQDNLSIGNLEIALQSNEVSFIEVKPKMGWKAFKMSVEEIPADVGQSLILKGTALN